MTEQSKKLFALEIVASVYHGTGCSIATIMGESDKLIHYLNKDDERKESKEAAPDGGSICRTNG